MAITLNNPYKITNPYAASGTGQSSALPKMPYSNVSSPYATLNKPKTNNVSASIVSPATSAKAQVTNRIAGATTAPSTIYFNPTQLSGLNAAYNRQQAGQASDEDIRNLIYASSRGFTPTTNTPAPTPAPNPTPTPTPVAPNPQVDVPQLSDASYREAALAYINSLAPSSGVTDARRKYEDFVTSANLGMEAKEGQGRGIPLALVRGQQEKLYNQAQIQANRLQGDLDIATNEQTAAQNQALARMNFEKGLYDMGAGKNDALIQFQNKLAEGGYKPYTGAAGETPITLIDPSGKSIQVVAPAGYKEISAGASIYDPKTGQIVSSAPAKQDTPTSYQEWVLAGSPGTYESWVQSKGGSANQKIVNINGTDYVQNADGSFSLPNLPSGGANALPSYSEEKATRILSSINEISNEINGKVSGFFGKSLSLIPGTPAFDFQQRLNTLAANIAFSELQAMRDASKTGGALGQVSERELALLESSLGALNIGQSPEQLKSQLQKIKESITRWQDAVKASKQTPASAPASGDGWF